MSLEVVLTEPLGLPIGFPLIPFLNGILYNRKYALLFDFNLLLFFSFITYIHNIQFFNRLIVSYQLYFKCIIKGWPIFTDHSVICKS